MSTSDDDMAAAMESSGTVEVTAILRAAPTSGKRQHRTVSDCQNRTG
jgi:hypothetical protein